MLDDHRQVKVINGIPKVPEGARFKGSDGGQRHGDSAVAFCLAWNAAAFQALGGLGGRGGGWPKARKLHFG